MRDAEAERRAPKLKRKRGLKQKRGADQKRRKEERGAEAERNRGWEKRIFQHLFSFKSSQKKKILVNSFVLDLIFSMN